MEPDERGGCLPPPPVSPVITRGRPRSTSISNGSPGPPPGASVPLPSFFPPEPSSGASSWSARNHFPHGSTSSSGFGGIGSGLGVSTGGAAAGGVGWGHRSSLSVPGILAPLPVVPGSTSRLNRHRRTQSVSPPGFPTISELEAVTPANPPPSTSHMVVEKRRESPHREHPHPIAISTRPASRLPSSSSSPTNASPLHSPSSSFSSSSPTSSHNPHAHAAFPSSHAALLSGVRSHALPRSPILAACEPGIPLAASHPGPSPSPPPQVLPAPTAQRTSFGAGSQSPPFGPTTPFLLHHPPSSPLALEVPRGSPEMDLDDVVFHGGGGDDVGLYGEDGRLPGAFDGSIQAPSSPPLLPLPFMPSPPAHVMQTDELGAFGRSEPHSPASLYLEKEVISPPLGQCDLRTSPQEQRAISPPLSSPPLFVNAKVLPAPSSPATLVPAPIEPSRPRARSFTSERNFAPALIPPPPSFPLAGPILPPSSPPARPASPPPPNALQAFEALLPSPDLLPPPSPHRNNISLPPPPVAPAPLPPHLGGPPLHHARLLGTKSARAHSSLLADKLGAADRGGFAEFIPKRHSPLASPGLKGEDSEDEEETRTEVGLGHDGQNAEELARALTDAGATEMDRGKVGGGGRALSPIGDPEHLEHEPGVPVEEEEERDSWGWGGITLGEEDEDAKGLDGGEDGDLGNGLRRADRARSVSPPPVVGQPSALGFMDVDGPTAAGQVLEREGGEEGSGEVISIDEESLSALERIFVCAKSSEPNERARVAHSLADWLVNVSMEEAVEYVLPLLAGLATDNEELVKEVFAPQLDRIMWHFFSQCPLIELDCNDTDGDADQADNASPVGSPVPSRYTPLPPALPAPTSTHFLSDDSSSYTPPTSKTSPSNTEVSDAPRISATTFTSLLGALLTDQSTVVANSTQNALVRFLCRLKGKPFPLAPTLSSPSGPSTALAPYERPVLEAASTHQVPYNLTEEARRVLEDEFVHGIVLGLARLDDDDRDGDKGMDGVECGSSIQSRSPGRLDDHQLVLSPEEEHIEDGWMGSNQNEHGQAPGPTAESWGEPLVGYFGGAPVEPSKSEYSLHPENSPAGQVYSSFSPDGGQGEEESAIGKLVSMSLISAIAATDCLEPDVLADQILLEVDRMKSEPMFYVRKEAAVALGSLARSLPLEVFESDVLPLHSTFARDTLWHVRRAACLALPTIFKRLPPDLLRAQTITNVKAFANDESRNVRSGLLEVCGELVYLFHGDPAGVPDEMLAFFLGKPIGPPPEADDVFTPLPSALDSPPQTFYDSAPSWAPSGGTSFMAMSRDPDRPVMCAFNLPAVALTLGREKWHLLQEYYLELCRDKADKVRQSLASSMHEIANIIGPDQADRYLLEPFSWFLRDFDHIQAAVLENLSSLLASFGQDAARRALELVAERWGEIKLWRRREAVAKQLARVGGQFLTTGAAEEFLSVLVKAFKDPVASVRENAVYAVPHMFVTTESDSIARSKLRAFLGVFSEDSGFRHRTTYTSCVLAAVRGGVSRETFETYFLDPLSRLARDSVINVRIGVARVIAEACRSPALYADPASRIPLEETLHHLYHSTDRDVSGTVAEFCTALSAPPDSPPPSVESRLDRSGALSRMSMNFDDEASYQRLPSAVMNPNAHGTGDEPEERMMDSGAGEGEDGIEGVEEGVLLFSDSSAGYAGSGEGQGEGEGADDDDDARARPPQLWTTELEGEDEFLEVSRR